MPMPKKPTALRILQGNPGRVKINENEPKVKNEIPAPPSYLKGLALIEWERITPLLFDAGLLSSIDRVELANYCQCVETIEVATRQIEELGYVHITEKGNQVQAPWVGIRNQAMLNAHKFLVEYGMTPASRSKVTVEKSTKENRFAKFG